MMLDSSPACLSPAGMSGENSPLTSQTPAIHSGASQTLRGMTEGSVTVLPFHPPAPERSEQEAWDLYRLFSQNAGLHLRISPDGAVSGGSQENDPYEILRLKAVSVGVVAVRGEKAERYLAMNRNGHLYGSQTTNDECYFLETLEANHYNTYVSQKYGWYVALKKNGKPKRGPDTHRGQKAIFFLPRRATDIVRE